jgi:RNA polymerase sigma-70 factor (ECF subfamily)
MDERTLVGRARGGDFDAFMELVNAHKEKVYAVIRRLAGNVQDAEDIMQETLLRAVDNIDTFREESSFGTWLYAIGLNQARAHHARESRVDLGPIEEYLPGGAGDHGTEASRRLFDWGDPHSLMEAQELQEAIEQGLAQLPYKYREAFLLRYTEEMAVKEIAIIIGESEAATKSRILRARLALRGFLSKRFEDRYGRRVS